MHTALMIALLLAQDPQAYSCTGTSDADIKMGKEVGKQSTDLPEQIYVIDPDKNQVRHALLGKREYEDMCAVVAPNCTVSITPTRAQASGTTQGANSSTITVGFDLNRTSGAGKFELTMTFPDDQHVKIRWTMKCKPTTAPVF